MFARLLIEKDLFSSQLDLLQVRFYYLTIVYDIIKFQIDLVILASSKNFDNRLLRPAKVNKVKIFSGPSYIIKRVLTFVSGVQESVLVDFVSQKEVKILHKVKACQNCLHQKSPYKNEQICIFYIFFQFLSCY